MISEKLKQEVRAVLYAPAPTDEQLIEFTGVKGMRQIRHLAKAGSANSYNAYVLMWKSLCISYIITEHEEREKEENHNYVKLLQKIREILESEPTAEEMAKNSGVPLHSITQQIKNGSYGHKYHKYSYIIEQVAKLVDAG